MSGHEIGIIVAVASLITAIVALSTVYFLRKQFVISEKSFNSSQLAYEDTRKSYEVDTFLRIKEKFLEPQVLELSERALLPDEQPIFKDNGGTIERKTVYNTLNMINEISMFINMGIISEELVIDSLGGIINNIYSHKDIHEYIEKNQKRVGSTEVWAGVKQLSDKYESSWKPDIQKDVKS